MKRQPLSSLRSLKRRPLSGTAKVFVCLLASATLAGCLGETLPETGTGSSQTSTSNSTTLKAEELVSQEAAGARVRFRATDFYGLTFPHPSTRCAGDAKSYLKLYDLNDPSRATLSGLGYSLHGDYAGELDYAASSDATKDTGALPFNLSTVVTSQTLHPDFIRDISVDLTDANASVSGNNASSCALPSSAVPTSVCATFDFGNAGGLPSSLGGTIFFLGGIHTNTKGSTTADDTDARVGYNYAGVYDPAAPYTTYLGSSSGSTFNSGTARSHSVSCGPQAPSSVLGATNTYEYFKNRCDTFMYTLGVDRLPASTADGSSTSFAPGLSAPPANNEPITMWGNLKPTDSTVAAPRFVAGATAAYSPILNQVLLFGGSAPIGMTSATSESAELAETWVYDIKKQVWEKLDATATTDPLITRQEDLEDWNNTITGSFALEKETPGRAYFGAAALPYTAMASLPTKTGDRTTWSIDTTEYIYSTGGTASGTADRDTHRFNPTFGPSYMDSGDAATGGTFPANLPILTKTFSGIPADQWIDSNQTTLVTNRYVNFDPTLGSTQCFTETLLPTSQFISFFSPKLPTQLLLGTSGTCAGPDFTLAIGERTNTPAILGLFGGSTATDLIGHVVSVGGFSTSISSIPITTTPAVVLPDFRPEVLWRTQGADGEALDHAAQFAMVANQSDGTRRFPGLWHPLGPSTDRPLKWYGAANALPGYNRGTDLVYFGGSKCNNFATDNSDSNCAMTGQTNPGKILRYGSVLSNLDQVPNAGAAPSAPGMAESIPTRGGMAAARGYTSAGAPILVAWGGLDQPLTESTTGSFYVMTFNSVTGAGTWSTATTVTDAPSPTITFGSMVYSHVTQKFYLYGGLQYAGSSLQNNASTYEITVTGTATPFTVAFKKLTPICSPSCPSARRGHQMVEVNYNADPALWAGTGKAWQSYTPGSGTLCTPDAPCSFGIFMEGGTSTGTSLLADRWLFDPTANGGQGLWQRVDSFPARKLAHSASVQLTPATDVISGATTTPTKNYVLLFGGESGLSNPAMIPTSGTGYVAPTFGDTWLFDFADKKWHRVRLAGKGYTTFPTTASGYSEFQLREAFQIKLSTGDTPSRPAAIAGGVALGTMVDDANLNVLTPPPLAGGMMVVRTHNGPRKTSDPAKAGSPHRIPEVFLLGGRKKDGTLLSFGEVYKFCTGTSGERIATNATPGTDTYNDGSCDAYDPVKNPESSSPTADYVGRWLKKTPDASGLTKPSAFLGAATYDPDADVIAVFGGLKGASASSTVDLNNTFYVYTPTKSSAVVTASLDNGSWTTLSNCPLTAPATVPSPEPRYGHTMHYDNPTHQYVIVGGYDSTGKPLTSSVTSTKANTSYTSPQIWVGKRLETEADISTLNYAGYSIDEAALTPASFPCMVWRQVSAVGNHPLVNSEAPPQGTLAHAASVYIPPTGYNTGYYSLFDHACDNAGPYNSGDSASSRKFAGGAYIDLDRAKLGERENVLLHLKFIPLTEQQVRPDGSRFTGSERAVLNIHLITTGQNENAILSVPQPRHFQYANPPSQIPAPYPEADHSFSVFARPDGMLREEQIVVPLASFPTANRIRIERESGSAILIEASVIRLGRPSSN